MIFLFIGGKIVPILAPILGHLRGFPVYKKGPGIAVNFNSSDPFGDKNPPGGVELSGLIWSEDLR